MSAGRLAAAALASFLAVGWSGSALAQKKRGGKRPAQAAEKRAKEQPREARDKEKAPKVEVEREGGKKVYRIKTEFVIEGRIQKPNAFYVLQRSSINYEWVDLKRRFIPHILNSVRESPF